MIIPHSQAIEHIAKNNFPFIRDMSVLELGPQVGWFTNSLLNYTDKITSIEFDTNSAATFKNNFKDKVDLVVDNFDDVVKTIGQFDAVVLYGVLYHHCAPIKLIEDIVNYVKPKKILLETQLIDPSIIWAEEKTNIIGNRFSNVKTGGLVLIVGLELYIKVLNNMGYVETNRHQMPIDATFKEGCIYSIFELA